MTARKLSVIIISFALAYMVAEGLFPTPNIVDGGAAKMFILIFLAIGIKAAIEFLLGKWKREKD